MAKHTVHVLPKKQVSHHRLVPQQVTLSENIYSFFISLVLQKVSIWNFNEGFFEHSIEVFVDLIE